MLIFACREIVIYYDIQYFPNSISGESTINCVREAKRDSVLQPFSSYRII